MKNIEIKQYRQHLIQWSKGILAIGFTGVLAFAGRATFKKPIKKKSQQMLTEDGSLVEIDPRAIVINKQKIRSEDIHHWIKK
ncbi:MAG: hypothetical protein ABI761_13730 [Saprospiraceae bacterium]